MKKIMDFMREKKLDAILVADGFNMRYLSGFTGATGFSVVEISSARGYAENLCDLISQDQVVNLGFEDEIMTYSAVEKLKKKLMVCRWEPLGDSLSGFRRIKRARETGWMAKAEALGDEAFTYILGELRPGVTELEIAAKLEYYFKTHGAEDISFPSIVASGIHSSMPHATPSRKTLEKGDFVTLDFGCRYQGYCSDMTRTVAYGQVGSKQAEIYNHVLKAQKLALDGIKSGIKGKDGDKIARDYFAKENLENYFTHSLGHGVGIDIHEGVGLTPREERVLEKNMILTVEPGLYIDGEFGVRIEDMVQIIENSVNNLTKADKKLIIL